MRLSRGAFAVGQRGAMRLGAALAAAIAMGSGPALAQLTSDDVPRTRTIAAKEQLDLDMQRSRFHLGPVRFLPGFEVSNAGYNSNVFGHPQNPVSDWTATVNVGTKLILPFGPKIFFLGDAYPGYTWYASHSDLSHFSGTAGASIAGYFNRLSFEIGARGSESETIHTEQPTPSVSKTVRGFGRVDVDLTSRLAFFAGGEERRVRETQTEVPLPNGFDVVRYNRTDDAVAGGFRYALGSGWDFAPEVQFTTTRFVLTPEERNNKSLAYLLGIGYNRPRLFLKIVGGYREGRPYQASSFPSYSTGVGSFFVSYFVTPWLEAKGYGRRHVAYSADNVNPYYYSNQIGGGLNVQVLSRVLLKAFAEASENRYPIAVAFQGSEINRRDKPVSYGGGASVILLRRLTLTALVAQKRNDSNIPTSDYSVVQVSTFLTFAGEFLR
jgi:hypothetical protein